MGNYWSTPLPSKTYRIMSYNVEWGFLKLPDDITHDSGGHTIPKTDEAQRQHLRIISKNIGLASPHICFLQEMGSLEAVQFVADAIFSIFNIKYDVYYSNGDETGYQGVGLLVQEDISTECEISNIPDFKLNRALGVILTTNEKTYKLIGVHLKSLYDGKYTRDVAIQNSEIEAVLEWVGDCENVLFCGDFNNVPTSSPIQNVISKKYTNILDTDKYVENISGIKATEFSKSKSHPNSVIDYMFVTNPDTLISSHIIDYQRVATVPNAKYRSENSDHLPILGVFTL